MELNEQKILITGGTGFIGRHLARYFAEREAEVTILSRRKVPEVLSGLSLSYILKETESLTVEDLRPFSSIFHLAAITPYNCSFDEKTLKEKNVNQVRHLLELMRQSQIERKFVFASSVAVYGLASEEAHGEEDVLNPRNGYAQSKAEGERLILNYAQKYPWMKNYLILRLANIYGPDQPLGWFIPDTIQKIKDSIADGSLQIAVYNGDSFRDYLHVRDVADACGLLLSKNRTGIFNVGSGDSKKIKEVVSTLISLAQKKFLEKIKRGLNRESIKVEYINKEINFSRIDINKLWSEGWTPKISLAAGLEKVLNEYLE